VVVTPVAAQVETTAQAVQLVRVGLTLS